MHFVEMAQSNNQHPSIAIVLDAFTEYECAKDEASIPLSSRIFAKINALESELWLVELEELGIKD